MVRTWTHTPRRCGEALSAGALVFLCSARRPSRMSWMTVGIVNTCSGFWVVGSGQLPRTPNPEPRTARTYQGSLNFSITSGVAIRRSASRLLGLRLQRQQLGGGLDHLPPPVGVEGGAGGDQVPHDDVLLQPDQRVALAARRGLGQHPRGLLEAGGRDEAVRGEAGLRDAQPDRGALGGLAALLLDPLVLLGE